MLMEQIIRVTQERQGAKFLAIELAAVGNLYKKILEILKTEEDKQLAMKTKQLETVQEENI